MLLANKRIFIVEDRMAYFMISATFLQGAGAMVIADQWGTNTPEVLLKHLPIDLILLDLVLAHNLSGFDVFDQIQAAPELRAIPVVAVSAADPDIAMLIAYQKGFAGYLSKPISAAIVSDVATILKGGHVWKANDWQDWTPADSFR